MTVNLDVKVKTPNERQSLCINNFEGKYMVLAGPGTGKTYTIMHRIQNMLSNGVNPDRILCLTFSKTAADEMKKRLLEISGEVASSIKVHTYHAFCNDLIAQNPMEYGLSANFKVIKDSQKLELMKRVIDKANLVTYVPPNAHKYHFADDFIKIVEKLSAKRLSEEEYLKYLEENPDYYPKLRELEDEIYQRESEGKFQNKDRYKKVDGIKKNIEKAKEVWKIATLYQEEKREAGFVDFVDMINLVLDVFENNKIFALKVANEYDYLLLDEYQDTNNPQNELIFHLLDNMENKNVMVVGDDDQIIYGFQGAGDDNIERFKERYPETRVICLNENNRSTQEILDFSHKLMEQNPRRIENVGIFKKENVSKRLVAKNEEVIKKTKKIRKWHFNNLMQEMNEIIDDIERLIESDECPHKLSEIAVLFREKNEVKKLATMLEMRNIPCQIADGKDIFLIRSVVLTYFYIKALANKEKYADKLFSILLDGPFEINIKDYNKILWETSTGKKELRKDFITVMQEGKDFVEQDKIDKFLNDYNYLKNYIKAHNLRDCVIEILNRCDIISFFFKLKENTYENIEGIKALLDEVQSYQETKPDASLYDFVLYVDENYENEIPIMTQKTSNIQNAVQILTYHGSKGREFEHVYLPNLISKKWEKSRGGNKYKLITDSCQVEEKTDVDNLRLLFVGITRAKHSLTISFADFTDEKPESVTKYLANINDFDFDYKLFECNDDDYLAQYVKTISNKAKDNEKELRDIIQNKIDNFILSPSRLNDYLNCPRSFLYNRIFEIDVQEGNWDYANLGTCVHKAIENAEREKMNKNEYPSLYTMIEDFVNMLNKAKISKEEIREKFERDGKKMLEDYYPVFSSVEEGLYKVEFPLNDVKIGNYTITGKIDRIEENKNGTYSLYDYKTGSPISEKEVCEKGGEAEYYRQLCFYKYAFEKLTGKHVEDVCLIYLKDTKKNVRKQLTDSDMQYIEDTILDCYKRIENFDFDPIENEDNCKYCAYKKMCKLDIL